MAIFQSIVDSCVQYGASFELKFVCIKVQHRLDRAINQSVPLSTCVHYKLEPLGGACLKLYSEESVKHHFCCATK